MFTLPFDSSTRFNESEIEFLNHGAPSFLAVDRSALDRDLAANLPNSNQLSQMFADVPLFLSRQHVEQMARLIQAVENVTRLAGLRAAVADQAPPDVLYDTPSPGVFFGYDFHLSPDGLRLIEINTNAGGAILNNHLARATQPCCPVVNQFLARFTDPAELNRDIIAMFQKEWEAHGLGRELKTIAIVDTSPEQQPLFPEFQLFSHLLGESGIHVVIADPADLAMAKGRLQLNDLPIDLVYNRSCDFYLQAPQHEALKQAYLTAAAVVTPHPSAYALYADKRNLVWFSNPELLRKWGADAQTTEILTRGIPTTVRVTQDNGKDLWSRRRQLFFKPAMGFGSRGVYRGAKLTRQKWSMILEGGYLAQDLVPPGERMIHDVDGPRVLKADIRAYAYAGKIQSLAARLYRGQTTNLSTPGGGFAAVYCESEPPHQKRTS